MNSRTPFVQAGTGPSRARARAEWIWLLERAAKLGDAAVAGEDLAKSDAITFAGSVIRTTKDPFPLPFESAKAAAEGFRAIARGFVAAAQPELRRALGQAMAAAARCCSRMLQLDTDEKTAVWRKRTGED